MDSSSSFNASVTVTELLMKTLENVSKELASRCIREVSVRHNLNAEEEIRILGLENLSLIRKEMKRKSVSGSGSEKVKKEKKVKEEKKIVEKPSIIMPFVSECVDKDGCEGLNFNRSLFTQCSKKKMENGSFCSKCQTEADKNTSGIPDCGTVTMRLSQGLYEFKDPSGRSPVSYLKVLDKLKINKEIALEEACKFNIKIPEEHLNIIEKAEKKSSISRGRPKKESVKISTEDVSDLFAKLTVDDATFEEDVVSVSDVVEEVKPKKSKLSEEEKAAKKAALDAEREAKKQEREAKLAEEKEKKRLEKEAKLLENKSQTKAEKEAKLAEEKAQAKAEKEAKLAEEKEQKRLEKEAKIAQAKAEKEAKIAQEKAEREAKREAEKAAKAEKKPKATTKKEVVKAEATKAEPVVKADTKAEAAPPAKVSVTRKEINGKQYLKSSSNILYDPLTKEEVGLWDPETETIKELPEEEDDEVEEEEYESDDN